MQAEVILMAGLPGSGKTSYLSRMGNQGWTTFDDFKIGTRDLKFRTSPRFQTLIDSLRNGKRCLIADIDFCDARSRVEAEHDLRAEIPDLKFRWIFFENNPAACKANIRSRIDRPEQTREWELRYVDEKSPAFTIPPDAEVRPVWRQHAN